MKTYKILFVCLGNICRSPAGENVMRHFLRSKGISSILVDSAGTAGYHIGKQPDLRMRAELEGRSIHVSGHAQQFSPKHFQEYDLIIPMDKSNENNILKLAKSGEEKAKVKPFMDFCTAFSNPEVPDPYYDGDDAFKHVVDIMEDGCEGILSYLKTIEVFD